MFKFTSGSAASQTLHRSIESNVVQDYDGLACTPTNATQLPNGICRGLYVTGTGNVAGTMADGTTTFVLTGVPANTLIPINVSIVASTATTATNIFTLY